MNKKVVFYGGGNMAEGILKCLLKKGIFQAEDLTIAEVVPARREYLTETYKLKAVADASAEIKEADLVIIAVLPSMVADISAKLKDLLKDGAIVMSIAAGISIHVIEERLKPESKAVRIMPNTLSQSGNGYSALCINQYCTDEDKAFIEEIVSSLGQVMPLDDDMFNLFSAFSCTGPLWVYKTIEALINAGVHSGFSRAASRDIVIKNMIGAAMVLDMSGDHPAARVDQMTSPAGSTIEALTVLEEEAFASAILKSVAASVDKTNSLK